MDFFKEIFIFVTGIRCLEKSKYLEVTYKGKVKEIIIYTQRIGYPKSE